MKSNSKMRTFWIGLIFCIIYPCSLYPQATIDIVQKNWRVEEERSLGSTPIIRLEGDLITIYSDKSLEDLTVEIRELSGTLVSQTAITTIAGTIYPIYIADLASGNYSIRISQGEKYILGYFNK